MVCKPILVLCFGPNQGFGLGLRPGPSQTIRKKLTYSSQSTPTSFTLGNLHKHLLGVAPAQSHGAEADCEALLRTSAVLGEDWIKWVKDNSYPFAKCKKMWG